MKIECRPKYFENSCIIRDYILIFLFNGQKFVSSYHNKIINLLVKNPNFNLVFYLSIKLGFYLKELQSFMLSTQDGNDKVYIPLDYSEEWKLIKHVFSILNISFDFSHPAVVNNIQINPSGTNNRSGFFLNLIITKRTENRHYNGICTIYNQNLSDKKTVGHHYNKEYTFDWNDDSIYFKNLMEKILNVSKYIENILNEKYILDENEIVIIKRGINTIFNSSASISGSSFLRGLFNEYKSDDKDHQVAINHLKILEIDPQDFIKELIMNCPNHVSYIS